jgi:hypothetical protein
MSIKIEVRGIADSMKKIERDYHEFLERVADRVLEEAPKFTPKRSGRAARGWQKEGSALDVAVVNSVPYIGYLEKPYVRSRQAPQGIIGPTLTSVKRKMK